MLRQSNFIILDEASSSIDLATDDQVCLVSFEPLSKVLICLTMPCRFNERYEKK